MVQIPQITRDRIASSAVGTPGVDTSGQQMGQAVGETLDKASDIGFDYAVKRRQELDTAEANNLMTGYKMNSVNMMEQLKTKYAQNPEAAGDELMQSLKTGLDDMQSSASNPRVKLMVGKGDSYFDGIMIRQQQAWALSQRDRLDASKFVQGANDIAGAMNKITAKDEDLYAVQKAQMLPLWSALGNVSAGAHAQLSPESAAKFEAATVRSSHKGAIYGWMNSNPAKASQFLNEPEVKNSMDPKDWSEANSAAQEKIKNLPEQLKWNEVRNQLMDSPKAVADVVTGKVDWNSLDQAPPSELVTELKKMALTGSQGVAQVQNEAERARAETNFLDEAARLGFGAKKGDAPPERSVADLLKFQTSLVKATNDGFIDKRTLTTWTRQLVKPMNDAVLAAHDPGFLEAVHKGFDQMQGKAPQPQDVVDRYVGGYNVINKYLQTTGGDKDPQVKANMLRKYLNFWDSVTPETRDAAGRPYTTQTAAQAVIGIEQGKLMSTPLGALSIDYHDKDGQPGHNFSKEEMDRFDHLKSVRAAQRSQ